MTHRVLCTSHRGPTAVTQGCFAQLASAGWPVHIMAGQADLALARNRHLTSAVERWPAEKGHVLLLVDDDMEFSVRDAEIVCERAARLSVAQTGIYVTGARTYALGRMHSAWVAGLGFLAVPMVRLHQLARRSQRVMWSGEMVIAFTWCGPDGLGLPSQERLSTWVSEDYRLCDRLGGVGVVEEVQLGHVKHTPIYPPEQINLEAIARQLDAQEIRSA